MKRSMLTQLPVAIAVPWLSPDVHQCVGLNCRSELRSDNPDSREPEP